MKRLCSMILLLAALSCLTACGKGSQTGQTDANSGATSRKEESVMQQSRESKGNTDILVAYFSCTGTTKPLAEYAAEYLNADLYEIKAETPYTSEDLDYNPSGSRANKEQDDASARPAISGKVEDMDKYHTVVLAYAGGIIGLN